MKKIFFSTILVLLVLCSVFFSACSGQYEYSSNEYIYDVGSSTVPMAKVYDYSFNTNGKELTEIKEEVVAKINDYGQLVSVEQYIYDNNGHYELEAKIAVDKVQEFTEYLEKNENLKISSKRVTSYDFSNASTTIPSKIAQLETNKSYYQSLLDEATSITDKIAVNKEIISIDSEITDLNIELENIKNRMNYSKVEIYITNENCFDVSILFIAILGIIAVALPIILIVVIIVVVSNKNRKIRELQLNGGKETTINNNNGKDVNGKDVKDFYYKD